MASVIRSLVGFGEHERFNSAVTSKFDGLTIRDALPIVWLKRLIVSVFAALLLIGAVASHRAYFPVRSLDVKAPHLLTDGSVVEVAVVCSGRNMIDVEAELIQGEHTEALFSFRVPGNNLAFFDPRAQHASQTTVVSKEILARLQPGPARLRVVATGRPQWGRRPPPTVRELDVTIQTNSASLWVLCVNPHRQND